MLGFTLNRYLSIQFIKVILAVFGTIFALVFVLDFVELMRRAGEAPGATPARMARLALFRTPAIAEQVLPFAVLFGAMAALLQLSRKLELVIARAAGISAWQFLQPAFFVALGLGIFSVVAYNPVSAGLKQRASDLEAGIFTRANADTGKELWIRQLSVDGSAVIRAEAAVEATTKILLPVAFVYAPSGKFEERIEAKEGTLHEGYWEFLEASVISPGNDPVRYGTYLLASNLEASQIRQRFTPPESVSFWDLAETIEQTERAGLDAARYRLQENSLLARPLLLLAMVFVAASVSLRFFRFGGVARMVLSGVAAGFLLYVATKVMGDLGASGMVAPGVAAWFPAVVGSLLGSLALLYQEDG